MHRGRKRWGTNNMDLRELLPSPWLLFCPHLHHILPSQLLPKPLCAHKVHLFTCPLDPISLLLAHSSLALFPSLWSFSLKGSIALLFLRVSCPWSSSSYCFRFVLNPLFSHTLCLICQHTVSYVLKMYSKSHYLVHCYHPKIRYSDKLKSDLPWITGIASHGSIASLRLIINRVTNVIFSKFKSNHTTVLKKTHWWLSNTRWSHHHSSQHVSAQSDDPATLSSPVSFHLAYQTSSHIFCSLNPKYTPPSGCLCLFSPHTSSWICSSFLKDLSSKIIFSAKNVRSPPI